MRPLSLCFLLSLLSALAVGRVPEAPLIAALKAGGSTPLDDLSLRWEHVAGATSYSVYRTEDLATPLALLTSVASNEYLDVGVVPGPPANPPDLYYRVTAVNGSGESVPSNWAFKIAVDLFAGGGNLLGFPYSFYPDGDWSNPIQFGRYACGHLDDGCDDFGSSNLVELVRVLGRLTPRTDSCYAPYPPLFELQAGAAYFLNRWDDCTTSMVGAMDPEYRVGGLSSVELFAGLNTVSVPCHVQATNALELCRHLEEDNGPGLHSIVRIDRLRRTPITQGCRFPVSIFDLTPGEGYFFVVGPEIYDIQWRTW